MARRKRIKTRRQTKRTMRDRAEQYDTWFDRQRMRELKECRDIDCDACIDHMNRTVMSASLCRMHDHARQEIGTPDADEKMTDAVSEEVRSGRKTVNETIEDLKSTLPLEVPDGDVLEAMLTVVREHRDTVRFLNDYTTCPEAHEAIDLPLQKVLPAWFLGGIRFLSKYYMLMHPSSELMLMDSSLVGEVLRSRNTRINAEDLLHVPFRTMFLEFSEPVRLVRELDAVGVGFMVRPRFHSYTVMWFIGDEKRHRVGDTPSIGYTSQYGIADVNVAPHEDTHRVLDIPMRTVEGYRLMAIPDYEPEKYALTEETREVRDAILVATRNIWDFITCRNIDYDGVPRNGKGGVTRERPVHRRQSECPREYRVIKVNKSVRTGTGGGPPPARNPEESVKVPGMFYKWVYCSDCGRCHRHDLLGRSCRRCGKQVGPMSNVTIKKWWHHEYYVGDGPVKDVSWEVRKS